MCATPIDKNGTTIIIRIYRRNKSKSFLCIRFGTTPHANKANFKRMIWPRYSQLTVIARQECEKENSPIDPWMNHFNHTDGSNAVDGFIVLPTPVNHNHSNWLCAVESNVIHKLNTLLAKNRTNLRILSLAHEILMRKFFIESRHLWH